MSIFEALTSFFAAFGTPIAFMFYLIFAIAISIGIFTYALGEWTMYRGPKVRFVVLMTLSIVLVLKCIVLIIWLTNNVTDDMLWKDTATFF